MFKREPRCMVINAPCPRNADPKRGNYCPWWWRKTWTDSDEIRQVKEGCGVPMLPNYLTALNKTMGHLAEEASGISNKASGIIERKIEQAFAPLPAFIRHVVTTLHQRVSQAEQLESDTKKLPPC